MFQVITFELKSYRREIWINPDKREHREGDKPAYVSRWPNGRKHVEEYVQNGIFYRENNKYAYITRLRDGTIDEGYKARNGMLK